MHAYMLYADIPVVPIACMLVAYMQVHIHISMRVDKISNSHLFSAADKAFAMGTIMFTIYFRGHHDAYVFPKKLSFPLSVTPPLVPRLESQGVSPLMNCPSTL